MFNAVAAVDNGLIDSAEKYLNSITGLSGKFIQTANGKNEKGTFSLIPMRRNDCSLLFCSRDQL